MRGRTASCCWPRVATVAPVVHAPASAATAHVRQICDVRRLEAELERIRLRGCAYEEEEFAAGLSCVAAPLLHNGQIIASIAVSSSTDRFAWRRDELTAALISPTSDSQQTLRFPS